MAGVPRSQGISRGSGIVKQLTRCESSLEQPVIPRSGTTRPFNPGHYPNLPSYSTAHPRERTTFGKPIAQHQADKLKLADRATKIRAARLLTYDAGAQKATGERAELEAGMAKLFASGVCGEVTLETMRIHGDYGLRQGLPRGAVLPGRAADDNRRGHHNEIQQPVIARRVLDEYAL
jgi:alkylation response protein AidB-like acyl-CoA dehydrogenase